jgi:signal transduction histidine kinase
VLSHDLGNMLYVASGRLELGQETGETEHLEATETALERASEMLENLTMAIRAGTLIDDVAPVEVGTAFRKAWNTQPTEPDSSVVVDEFRVCADETALQRLFENLVRNALEHGNEPSEVRVGQLSDGFYVEDDGDGIAPEERERVFEPGYTTKDDGTGIGLVSIQQIARAHGWRTAVVDGTDGGARFEFEDVDRPDQDAE